MQSLLYYRYLDCRMINDFVLYVFASFIVTSNYISHSKLNYFIKNHVIDYTGLVGLLVLTWT